jgi:hypothetical protein
MINKNLRCLLIIIVCAVTCTYAETATTDAVTSATREHSTNESAVPPETLTRGVSDSTKLQAENSRLTADINRVLSRQYSMVKAHKLLAYTTAALVLAADIEGTYHFFNMERIGHKIRDSANTANSGDESVDAVTQATTTVNPVYQAEGVKEAWLASESQSLRVLHGALIASSIIAYTATATVELTIPRLAKTPEGIRMAKIHRNIFYVHAILMAANVGLGYAESKALSRGDHNMVTKLGYTHMIIGFSLPVIMVGSGIVFHGQAH